MEKTLSGVFLYSSFRDNINHSIIMQKIAYIGTCISASFMSSYRCVCVRAMHIASLHVGILLFAVFFYAVLLYLTRSDVGDDIMDSLVLQVAIQGPLTAVCVVLVCSHMFCNISCATIPVQPFNLSLHLHMS